MGILHEEASGVTRNVANISRMRMTDGRSRPGRQSDRTATATEGGAEREEETRGER